MKIKKVVKSEQTVEVEINLPHYTKDGDYCYKIYGEKEWDCIVVSYPGENCCGIRNTVSSNALSGTQCSSDEFDFAYKTAIEHLEMLKDNLQEKE